MGLQFDSDSEFIFSYTLFYSPNFILGQSDVRVVANTNIAFFVRFRAFSFKSLPARAHRG